MYSIREGVFETNSSSTHSITICTKNEYDKWLKDEVFLNTGYWYGSDSKYANNNFLTKSEAIELVNSDKFHDENIDLENIDNWDILSEYLKEYGIYSKDTFNDDDWFEEYNETYVSPSCDEIVAFGYYGHS